MKAAPRAVRAFSLVELLMVIAILSLVAAFSIPAFRSVSAASSLAAARQIVVSELDFARQTALAQGVQVEVRFYELPGYGAAVGAAPSAFRAVQSVSIGDTATNVLNKVTYFPKPAVGTIDPTASPLLQNPISGATSVPGLGVNYRYAPIRFGPGGTVQGTDSTSTNTLASTNLFLTLVLDKAPIRAGKLPANFVTVQVDPVDGRVFTYQP